jgi:hypothetical protein
MAGRWTRTAAVDARNRFHEQQIRRRIFISHFGIPARSERRWLHRKPKRSD